MKPYSQKWNAGLLSILAICISLTLPLPAQTSRLDVNDVSFLWPVPVSVTDANDLLSLADAAADGPIMSPTVLNALIETARNVPGISFPAGDFNDPKKWKVAGIRINPTALGSHPEMLARAEVPGIRLIVQPITVSGGKIKLHDITAHVVFNYVVESAPPVKPDREAFGRIVQDLVQLKADLNLPSSPTTALLNVHPGFPPDPTLLTGKLKDFLKKHLSSTHLDRKQNGAISFMGIPGSFEPWIFFKVLVDTTAGTVAQVPVSGRFTPEKPLSQEISFFPDTNGKVSPAPLPPKTLSDTSTAILFPTLSSSQLLDPLIAGTTDPKLARFQMRDIADLAAHPQLTTTITTDCVSCHTESTRRHLTPSLISQSGTAFPLPAGISGVASEMLPKDRWNLRNFGWGFNFTGALGAPRGFHPTISQRAANEAAESADFINKNYLTP